MSLKPALWLALFFAAVIALAPALAEARAGGGSSVGSRGTRTYNSAPATPTAPQSRPVERSMTQPQQPARPVAPMQPQPSFFGGHPFMSGLMGGLIGAGIGGLLFGHGFFGGGFGFGFAGLLGLLLQVVIVVLLVRFAMNFFRKRAAGERTNFAYATADDMQARPTQPVYDTGRGGPARGAASRDEIGITDADYADFERLLVGIQKAWSERDLASFKRYLTPEMLSYFSEKLSANSSAGIENRVEDVQFETGDLAEAWSDGDLQYATVAMRWTARDYTVRADTGVLVEGRAGDRVEATEVWTFVRAPGSRWLLSAIQQT
jgi:predicted lipid-binding transport protein (Tim44 family)